MLMSEDSPSKKGFKVEKIILKLLGAKSHIGSGALKKKHDGSDDRYLYEVKHTDAKSYKFDLKYWKDNVTKNALRTGKDPIIVISFSEQYRIVIMDFEEFMTLRG